MSEHEPVVAGLDPWLAFLSHEAIVALPWLGLAVSLVLLAVGLLYFCIGRAVNVAWGTVMGCGTVLFACSMLLGAGAFGTLPDVGGGTASSQTEEHRTVANQAVEPDQASDDRVTVDSRLKAIESSVYKARSRDTRDDTVAALRQELVSLREEVEARIAQVTSSSAPMPAAKSPSTPTETLPTQNIDLSERLQVLEKQLADEVARRVSGAERAVETLREEQASRWSFMQAELQQLATSLRLAQETNAGFGTALESLRERQALRFDEVEELVRIAASSAQGLKAPVAQLGQIQTELLEWSMAANRALRPTIGARAALHNAELARLQSRAKSVADAVEPVPTVPNSPVPSSSGESNQ